MSEPAAEVPVEAPPAEAPPAEAPPAEAPPAEAPPAEAPPAEAAPAEAPPAEAPPAEAPPAEAPPAEAPPAEAPPAEAPPAEAPPAEAAPAPASEGVTFAAKVEEAWESGSDKVEKYSVTVTNGTAAAIADFELELANIAGLENSWDTTVIRVGDGLPALLGLPEHIKDAGGLAPGASHVLGFIVKKNAEGEPAFAVKAT